MNYPAEVLELSHSTLSAFHSCPRKLEFAKLFNIHAYGRSLPGDGGSAVHEAVGTYMLNKSKDEAIEKLLFHYPIDLNPNPMYSWSLEECYSSVIHTINWINEHSEFELANIKDKPAIEVPFVINIQHNIPDFMPVILRGYIDFIFYNRLYDSYCVFDLKGTSSKATDFTPQYKYDTQCTPYSLVLNAAMKKQIENLEVHYLVSKNSILEPSIQHLEFEKNERDLKEWTQDLLITLRTIKMYMDMEWFPRRGKSCFTFGKPCKFFDICDARDMQQIRNLMIMKEIDDKYKKPDFEPWITLDLEIAA